MSSSHARRRATFRLLTAVAMLTLSIGPAPAARADEIIEVPIVAPAAPPGRLATGPASGTSLGQAFQNEIEPNDTYPAATVLTGTNVVALGNIYPNGDLDYFAFTANTGDRVYAAVMTSGSANASTDSQLELFSIDGTTSLEFDDDDGSFGGLASSIAGAVLPGPGTFYLRVRHFSATNQLRPYRLYVRVQSGAPTGELEPNDDTGSAQPLPISGWITGSTSSTADIDFYALNLSAGDTVFLSLDLDPERDTVEWNGQVGLGLFGGSVLVVNDAGTASPDSEAFFYTVDRPGTYYVLVGLPAGGSSFGSYQLSVSVHAAQAGSCATYTSTDVPRPLADLGLTTSTLTIPGNPRIGDLNVSLVLTHTNMPDLDVHLISPAGNDNGLFTDIGSGTFTTLDIRLDDEAAIPIGVYTVVTNTVLMPELAYRLSWFDGEDAGGTWTLAVRDDASTNTGTLIGWSLTVCDPPPPPVCPAATWPTTVFATDFEANNGGFVSSGTQNEWEWGLPAFAPITTCNSGTSCWKTDLDNTYNASSSQDLIRAIPITDVVGPVWLTWAQKYQMENATFDHAYVQVQQQGGGSPRRLWQFLDATMANSVGNPAVTIQESAGWGLFTADISDYLGQTIELIFHVDTDTSVQLAGLAIDDVSVTACRSERIYLPAVQR